MNDFISREAVIKAVDDYTLTNCPKYMHDWATNLKRAILEDVKSDIDNIPTADVQPVKRGKWIATGRKNVYGGKEIECSECHFRVMVSPEHFENLSEYEAFCCHCGVKMEEE